MRTRALIAIAAIAAALIIAPTPAQAAARVSVANQSGSATIDASYGTVLNLRGSGFQSIKNGHGGLYVFFGTVSGNWRPSKGGQTGKDYFYVPDSETKNNKGFQKFVTFPGSDTAGAANGGEIKADGSWSTQIAVPGAVFKAVDRNGKSRTIDCRKVTCGIITVGAHGVKNANNETFTPVRVGNIYGSNPPASGDVPGATDPGAEEAAADEDETGEEATSTATGGAPALDVDRASAVPGRVLTFSATGLRPGDQVVATLDDGAAAVGPLTVGPNGQVAGALTLPRDLGPGTHVLKLSGTPGAPSISFAVQPLADDGPPWVAIGAAAGAALLLLAAIVFATVVLTRRRKGGDHASTPA